MARVLLRRALLPAAAGLVGWGAGNYGKSMWNSHMYLYVKKTDEMNDKKIRINGRIDGVRVGDFRRQYHGIICSKKHSHLCFFDCRDKSASVDIVMTTNGGYSRDEQVILSLIALHKGTFNFYVNRYACSAGTRIAFACDRIKMTNFSLISPIDAQISNSVGNPKEPVSYLKVLRSPELYPLPYILMARLSKTEDDNFLIEMEAKGNNFKKDKFVDLFLNERVPHDALYNYAKVKDLGLRIDLVDEIEGSS
ncbi:MAG: hypothetical protein Harvfovirus66_3 [Harvfovirus sp.]|uniref:Uncharacterized protein n=1 Tax=Harvfovirus sp. TaxID=2487768 RepID=A0A3G5A3P7_9VIRU|nr:MAG: hypothetical protein Harvfovirus66_3 [Harvfovirus sp.]